MRSAKGSFLRNQQGMLFGLDARLALGIFAVLSLVAGYVAWGRIETAREGRLYKELNDIAYALTQYQTDLGTFFVLTLDKDIDGTDSHEDIEALWDIAKIKPGFQSSWHGPYLPRHSRFLPGYGPLSVLYATGDRKNTCTTDSDCYVWLVLEQVPAAQWDAFNRAVDEGGGSYHEPLNAEIAVRRVQADAMTDPRMLFYRTVARAR